MQTSRYALVIILLSACIASRPPAPTPSPLEFDKANLDPSVNACTDFWRYSNGGWLVKNPIPPQYTAWGYGSMLAEENRKILREVLDATASKPAVQRSANEQKLADFWTSCMSEERINEVGLKPLQAEIDRIDSISDTRGLQEEFARLQSMGLNVPFAFYSNNDARNSAEVIGEVGQAGLRLPDRDYYVKTDERSKQIRDEYVKHVARMLELGGSSSVTAADQAQRIMRLETALAGGSMTRVEQRDPEAIYNRMTLDLASANAPNIDWVVYLKQRGVPNLTSINVAQPKFFAELSRQMTATPLDDWKAYLRWQLLSRLASALSAPFVDENFRFRNAYLVGQKKQQARWERCVQRANEQIGEALGQAYVDRKFTPVAKRRALELVDNLVYALGDNLSRLEWMSDETRKQALGKLGTFVRKIGYPDTWRDYSALRIADVPFVANELSANAFETRRDLNKIGKPVDRAEWLMTPPTYNAYYNPPQNEIVFPAGILQWPMFDIAQDDAFNYGAIGSVIGHELTHGFDDEGSQYDAQGNLKNWWTVEDRKKFEERAECIVRQFNSYEIEPGLPHNGKLVAGESIADLGGLIIAWEAWQKSLEGKPRPSVVNGYTPEQRFFLGFARSRASNATPEALRLRIATDPHPANKFRVNGPLSNMPQFSSAFACKSGDPMVRAANERCEIW